MSEILEKMEGQDRKMDEKEAQTAKERFAHALEMK